MKRRVHVGASAGMLTAFYQTTIYAFCIRMSTTTTTTNTTWVQIKKYNNYGNSICYTGFWSRYRRSNIRLCVSTLIHTDTCSYNGRTKCTLYQHSNNPFTHIHIYIGFSTPPYCFCFAHPLRAAMIYSLGLLLSVAVVGALFCIHCSSPFILTHPSGWH